MAIENTSERDPYIHLLGAMSDGNDRYITDMEAAGQRQLVNSDRLPTDARDEGGDEPYLALGFTFGDPDPNDDLFRPATLPPGWKREGTDHAMWSKLVDEHGRERASIFYKAAFYDRSAFMRLNTPVGYLRSCIDHNRRPVLDDSWLTAEVAISTFADIIADLEKQAAEADDLREQTGNEYWVGRAADLRAEADRTRVVAKALS